MCRKFTAYIATEKLSYHPTAPLAGEPIDLSVYKLK